MWFTVYCMNKLYVYLLSKAFQLASVSHAMHALTSSTIMPVEPCETFSVDDSGPNGWSHVLKLLGPPSVPKLITAHRPDHCC